MKNKEVSVKAGRKEWIGLAVIALPCMLYSMDLTVLNLAVPHISADLKPSAAQLLWILDIYGFLVAGFLITMGTLGDRIGRRKLLLLGAGAFGIASLIAAFANTAETLILARAFLGIAGATLAPSTLSLIRNMFADPAQRTMAIGIWAASYSAGGAVGPLVGGLMLEYFWWGSVFLLALPVMLLLLIAGPFLLPEFKDPNPGKTDLWSTILSLAAVLSSIYGLKQIASEGASAGALLFILAGILIGWAFLHRQRKLTHPMIDLNLFKIPAFTASLLIYSFGCFVMFGSFFYPYQYLQLVKGLTSIQAGLWALPSFAGFIIGSMLTSALLKHFSPRIVTAACLLLAAGGFILLTSITAASSIWIMITALVCFSLGFAPVVTLATDLIVSSAPPERAGAASAISETGAEFGGALGIAILGALGTAIYKNQMSREMPAAIPENIAAAAGQTLGGAVAEAQGLPANLKTGLLDIANQAFVTGLNWASFSSLFIMAGLSALAFFKLKKTKPAEAAPSSEE